MKVSFVTSGCVFESYVLRAVKRGIGRVVKRGLRKRGDGTYYLRPDVIREVLGIIALGPNLRCDGW